MNYRVIELEPLPEGISAEQLHNAIERRRGVHELKTEAATCLRGMTAYEAPGSIPLRSYYEYLGEELAAARRSHEFVRRTLLEQVLLSKHAIADLHLRLSMANSVEATDAYSTALARLQSGLLRSLQSLAELPLDPDYVEPEGNFQTERQFIEQHLVTPGSAIEPETKKDEENNGDGDTRVASNATGRPEPAVETEEPSPGRSRTAEPSTSPWSHRFGPPEAPGGGFAGPAMGMLHRPEDAAGQSPGREKWVSRQDRVPAGTTA
ncbi:hypothetical protein GC170_21335 [bacterium]|nr:hypothetical protein [bacterium]